jgi:hypothetical protein
MVPVAYLKILNYGDRRFAIMARVATVVRVRLSLGFV